MASKGRVLIVDDDLDTIGLIRVILEREGYSVTDALKGDEGLIKSSQENPDLVLIDIRLPDMDGNKLLKRIKEKNPEQSIIIITAYADVDNAITSLKFGADDFIKKPFDNAHLIHIINKSFEKKQIIKEKQELKKKYDKLAMKGKQLREKEKLALYSLSRCPGSSDKEISEKIGIPRTTLTGIKNKLKKKGVYREINVPNYPGLGFELMSVVSFELNPSRSYDINLGEKLGKEGDNCVVYSQVTDLEGFMVCILRGYTEYKKKIESHVNQLTYRDYFKKTRIIHFPLEISEVIRFMDYSPAIHELCKIKRELGPRDCFMNSAAKADVSKTELSLIKTLARYPESTDAEIAEKVSLSRARVSQLKKTLFGNNLMNTILLPDLGTIGAELMAVIYAKLNPESVESGRTGFVGEIKKEPSIVSAVLSGTEFLSIHALRDYEHYKGVYDRIRDAGGEYPLEGMDSTLLPVENIKYSRIDFSSVLD